MGGLGVGTVLLSTAAVTQEVRNKGFPYGLRSVGPED
jgi:hypothetical protein